jgi:dolichol-phosphate mannosyltransferase
LEEGRCSMSEISDQGWLLPRHRPRVSVIIPARNESAYIGACVASVRSALLGSEILPEVIVVDDGSTDNTADVVRRCPSSWGVRLVRLRASEGKGAAVLAGFRQARGELVAFIDADLELPAQGLVPMIRQAGHAPGLTCVVAARTRDSRRLSERVSSTLLRRVICMVLRLGISDTQAGLKVFPGWFARDVLPFAVQEHGWLFDIEMLLLAREHGLQLAEVPMEVHAVRPRSAGASVILQSLPSLLRYAARRWRPSLREAAAGTSTPKTARFLAVGLLNTGVDLLAFLGLLALRPIGRDPLLAAAYAVIAWGVASVCSYLLHSGYTFRARLPVAGFYLVTGSAVGLQALCTVIGTATGGGLGAIFGKAAGMGLSGVISYLGYNHLAGRGATLGARPAKLAPRHLEEAR